MRSKVSTISLAYVVSSLLLPSLATNLDGSQQSSTAITSDENISINQLDTILLDETEDNLDAFQEPFNEGVVGPDGGFVSGPNKGFTKSNGSENHSNTTTFTPSVSVENTPVEEVSVEDPATNINPTKNIKGPSFTEGVQVDAQPALSELISRRKTPTLIAQICRSREFQPTLENYWVSAADEWLKNYTVENQDSRDFRSRGLFGSIALKYLGCGDFYQGGQRGFPKNSCAVSCSDVVKAVDDVQKARKVFFVLNSAAGFAKKAGIIFDALSDVPRSVAELVNRMPPEGWHDTPAEEMSGIVFDTIDTVMLAASPSSPVEKLLKDGQNSLQAAKHYYDQAIQTSSQALGDCNPFKYEKAFNSEFEPSLTDLDLTPQENSCNTKDLQEGIPKDSELGKAVLRWKSVLEDARSFVVKLDDGVLGAARAEGSQALKGVFGVDPELQRYKKQGNEAAGIECILRDAVTMGRNKILKALTILLRGESPSADGATDISRILRQGHYLPASSEKSISEFEDAPIRRGIARDIFMKLFNNSLRAQLIYISCTKDIERSCASDKSGPQDLKACVPGGYVCYMYEWRDRGNRNKSRNRGPPGYDEWSEKPWEIDVKDIILSSFNNHMKTEPTENLVSLATLGEAKAAQFNVPVCISDYNWNSNLEREPFCTIDKNCSAKSMPCHCGAWGKDTISVWKDIGLMDSKHHDYYSETLCPRQIQKKISDPLERYVAYCNLDIRRWSSGSRVDGPSRHQGRDKYCGAIIATLEAMPRDPDTQELPRSNELDELDPSTKFTFLCHIKKGGRGCPMYKKTFDKLWMSWKEGEAFIDEPTRKRS